MNIGFFGGTFDPVHNGHVAMVKASLRDGGLDRLVLIPAGTTVHKPVERVSNAGIRYIMCCLAFGSFERVEVSKTEVLRESGSYTIETVRELRSRLAANDELFMVCGADILFDILGWRFPQDILRETSILASLRPGHERSAFEARADFLRDNYGARIRFFDAPQVEVSSTAVRAAAFAGEDIQGMVPATVAKFISRAGLYTADDPLDSLDAAALEKLRTYDRMLLGRLDGHRLEHSLLTMTTAARLAVRYGVDVFSAALAGLVHDCAKGLPPEKALQYVDPGDQATRNEPRLYHGPAGAGMARDEFGIMDPDVLAAIKCHATGCAGMTPLAMVLYLADKIEPSRDYPGAVLFRELAEKDMDTAFYASAETFVRSLAENGKPAHPDTLAAIEEVGRRKRLDH